MGYALTSIRHLAWASIPVLVNRCSFHSVKNEFKLRCPSFLLESRYYVKHGSFQSVKKDSDFISLNDSASQARKLGQGITPNSYLLPKALAPTTARSHSFCSCCCSDSSTTSPSDASESANSRHWCSDVIHRCRKPSPSPSPWRAAFSVPASRE